MKLALVQCSARKKAIPCEAKLLYSESTLFNSSLSYTLLNYEQVAILSAKHYCVKLDEILEPYNICLNTFSKNDIIEWSQIAANTILNKFPNITECHFYVGKEYREYLIPILEAKGIKCYSYLEHLGIGSKVAWFQQHTINPKQTKLF